MPGSDHVLSKGLLVDSGAAAITLGQALKIAASGIALPEQPVKVQVATAATDLIIGLAGENVDAVKVATGKAFLTVHILGIAKGVAGAGGVTIGARLKAAAGGQLVIATGGATDVVVGIALTAGVANDIFDVLLTPGARSS